jgi:23S rRNA (guanosine2251-2'-O)-methyltransferase
MAVVYGRHPVLEALEAGKTIDKILFQQGLTGELEKQIRRWCADNKVPLQIVPKEKLNQISHGNHQGVIAHLSEVQYFELSDVLPTVYERGETPLIVVTEGITDVRNFGAIARSADATGVHTLVTSRKGGALINADAIKTSAGALHRLPVCRESSALVAVEFLKNSGVQIAAAEVKGGVPLYQVDFKLPTAIILGAEGEGLTNAILAKADIRFYIPIVGKTESYNVSVAAGMTLYEAMKQRLTV